MDPIIGEFTITSGNDPATFHTSFARAINLDEGYELALKSIYHGPVNNLVFPTFILRSEETYGSPMETYQLIRLNTERFYEAPSDVLLEMHKQLIPKLDLHEIPTLFEKNGYMTLTMPKGLWLKVNERMFLNSVFKYTTYPSRQKRTTEDNEKKLTEHEKYINDLDAAQAANKYTLEAIETDIAPLTTSLKTYDLKEIADTVDVLKRRTRLLNTAKTKTKTSIEGLEKNVKTLMEIDQELVFKKGFDKHLEETKIPVKVNELTEKLFRLTAKIDEQTLEDDLEAANIAIEAIKEQYALFDTKVTDNISEITRLDRSLTNGMETIKHQISEINNHLSDGESIEYSIDTSQIGSSEHKWLEVTTLAVSTTPIVRTKMAFLYASPVENSLINNRLSRMLTPIPITSKRGYNYVEFAQPLYRKIDVRNFMDISFEIIDLHKNKVKFQLFGDDLATDEKGNPIREYPTILNLHIRRPIKGINQ